MCPDGQLLQATLPEVFLYSPISQPVQLPAGPVNPGPHAAMQLALPAVDSVESGQGEHSCDDALYVFAGHGSQSTTLLTLALYVPGSHAVHAGSQGGSEHASAV